MLFLSNTHTSIQYISFFLLLLSSTSTILFFVSDSYFKKKNTKKKEEKKRKKQGEIRPPFNSSRNINSRTQVSTKNYIRFHRHYPIQQEIIEPTTPTYGCTSRELLMLRKQLIWHDCEWHLIYYYLWYLLRESWENKKKRLYKHILIDEKKLVIVYILLANEFCINWTFEHMRRTDCIDFTNRKVCIEILWFPSYAISKQIKILHLLFSFPKFKNSISLNIWKQ